MVDRRKRFTAADPMWQRSLTRFLSEDEDGEDVQHDSQMQGVFLRDAERESRMYVEKFLEQDKHRKEQAIESLAQQSLERLGALALVWLLLQPVRPAAIALVVVPDDQVVALALPDVVGAVPSRAKVDERAAAHVCGARARVCGSCGHAVCMCQRIRV